MTNVVLSIMAHPDDAEFVCAGTLARLVNEHGWEVHIASMTAGDCGSAELPPDEISNLRRGEGAAAAARLGGVYHCLEERDLLLFYSEQTLEKSIRLLREVRPQVVITHSPGDYMLDHEVTSTIARAAAFGAPMPNMFSRPGGHPRHPPPIEKVPHLYYADAIEGKDPLGRPVEPGFCIDITGTIDEKTEMLCCHASQREWLLKHHGMDEYVTSMREWAAARGRACGVAFAEGFRQHLGHGYPQDNLLGEVLGRLGPVSRRGSA
jgi:LmbE family N-acetylglucosaminyl deacetylase